MPSRVLGGGRVIGGSDNLSPPVTPQQRRLLSPAGSSASVDFPSSDVHDGLPAGESSATSTATPKLACPICSEEMVTLLQLNRHLDDIHRELPEEEQDDIKAWFRRRIIKAKQFQPVAVLNQKLKGLDVFESNDEAVAASTPTVSGGERAVSYRAPTEDEVTHQHWQKGGLNTLCSEPTCGKYLTPANGSINCRKCGLLFCEMHTMYQMKLSRSAQHEPVRGIWCRVCETCYKSRDGYNDHVGHERNLGEAFRASRAPFLERARLEVARLEKRLSKLTNSIADLTVRQHTTGAYLWQMTGGRNERKLLEQSIVSWEDDLGIAACPHCHREFTSYGVRRHHCRICGKVICGELDSLCSSEISLNVTPSGARGGAVVSIRMCKDCQYTIFTARELEQENATEQPIQRSYETLIQFRQGIELLAPKFQRLCTVLQDPNQAPSACQLAEAERVRKRLMDAFSKYDGVAKRIHALASESPSQQQLQKNVYLQARNFLDLKMMSLRSIQKVLKQVATADGRNPGGHGRVPSGHGSLLALNDNESSSQLSSTSAVSMMEGEERNLKERLIVLEEQRFLVQEMMAKARKQRHFDELSALNANAEDLAKEIRSANADLDRLNFQATHEKDMAGRMPT